MHAAMWCAVTEECAALRDAVIWYAVFLYSAVSLVVLGPVFGIMHTRLAGLLGPWVLLPPPLVQAGGCVVG